MFLFCPFLSESEMVPVAAAPLFDETPIPTTIYDETPVCSMYLLFFLFILRVHVF
jgi:hypothetical protein